MDKTLFGILFKKTIITMKSIDFCLSSTAVSMRFSLVRWIRLLLLLIMFSHVIYLDAQIRTIRYLPDTLTSFPNPERGLAPCIDPPWPSSITWDLKSCDGYNWTAWTAPLNTDSLNAWRNRGFSVVMIRYHIAEFRNTELSGPFLDRLNADFETARKTGFKIIPRFVYNWPMGGPDAPLDNVLKHIGQLKPVFKQNVDVTCFVDFGFIGCWGEQHHSCNGLVDGMLTPNNNSWQILDSLFAAVPSERMITLRYPFWKFRYFGSNDDKPTIPVNEIEAYTGIKKARWAHHDDCLVCGEWNVGTWNTSRNNAQEIINFLSEDNRFVFQGGEPGDPGTDDTPTDDDKDGYVFPNHTSCERMRWILEKEHWSILNASYGENFQNGAYSDWRKNGCMDEIARKLGYRFRLTEAQIPETAQPGSLFKMSFTIHNDGWASPHNPRGLAIVLRNKKTGRLNQIVITDGNNIPPDHANDPRFWDGGKSITVNVTVKLPTDLESGDYEVLLNLPDPYPSLNNRPEYSIRLANKDSWDEVTGYNSMLCKITVKR